MSLCGLKKDEPDKGDEIGSNQRENVNVLIAPFSIQRTQIDISPKNNESNDKNESLRLTFSDDGSGKYRIDLSTASYSAEDFICIANCRLSLFGLYFNDGFLAIFVERNPASWMKDHSDDTPLNALSIPGTHNSPTCHKALPSVRCQAVSPKEQLENGIRFFDVRLQVDDPDDKKSDELILVHSVFPIALSGSKKFRPLYEEILDFLRKNPSETVVLSVKREGTGDATDANLAQRLHDHYINEENWVVDSGIPTLGGARGKIVLFRRFKLNDEIRKLYGNASGINAQDWADNTANSQSGDVQVQDFYEVQETDNIEKKTKYVCDHCERAATTVVPVVTASVGQGENHGPLFVNFLSASNFWKTGCWPEKVAAKINPAVTQFLCQQFETNANAPKRGGSTGVLVCDWVGEDGNWDLIRAIIGMNEKLLTKDTADPIFLATAAAPGRRHEVADDEHTAGLRAGGRRGRGRAGGRTGRRGQQHQS